MKHELPRIKHEYTQIYIGKDLSFIRVNSCVICVDS